VLSDMACCGLSCICKVVLEMKKRIFAFLLSVTLCLTMFVSASAAGAHIADPDYYLENEEINELNAKAEDIYNDYGYYVMFCIVKSSDVEYVYDIASSEYDNTTDAEYGLAVAHNVDAGKIAVYVTDKAATVFDDDATQQLIDVYNASDSYFGGVYDSFETVEEILATNGSAISENSGKADEFEKVNRTLPLVVDNADLLSDDEEASLESKLDQLSNAYKTEIAVLTVPDLEGKTAQVYADDFYDYNGYGYGDNDDGLLVLYKPGEDGDRKLYITTHGTAIDAFSDQHIDTILEVMKPFCVDEDYVGAFNAFAEESEAILIEALTPPTVDWVWIPICLLVGFVISFIVSIIMTSSLKSVRSKVSASDYVRQNSLMVTGQQDIFLYSNVDRTRIKDDDDDSSTHTSSSGRTHGGGGSSF